MGSEALAGGTLAWGFASERSEVLFEAFGTTRSPQQVRPADPPKRGVHRLLARLRKRPMTMVPVVIATAVMAAPLPFRVSRAQYAATPVQLIGRATTLPTQDEVKYVPEYLTTAQINELDQLFALPAGPEDIIHLHE
jgi:hypothetical protein